MDERVTTPCQCTPRCEPQTKWVDGLEFNVSTWCNTPQPWNKIGSWLDAPEVEARVKAEIRKVCDLNALQNLIDETNELLEGDCETYWGSHGCSLEKNHPGPWHLCFDTYPDEDEQGFPNGDTGISICTAVMEWGPKSLIRWSDIGKGEESVWEPSGGCSIRY